MKIIRKNLDNITLFAYFSEYGPDFFKKLDHYSTCSVDVEEDGLTKIKYFYINNVGPLGQLYLESGDIKIELNWYECWDFVL